MYMYMYMHVCIVIMCIITCVHYHLTSSRACTELMRCLPSRYRIEISGGLGQLAGKIWRIGVMGYNATPENVKLLLRAMKDALNQSKV